EPGMAPAEQAPQPAQPPQAAPAQPPTGAEMPAGQAPTGAAPMTERDMCDLLTHDATVRVEDIQGGVAVVLVPKPGIDLPRVRAAARRAERALTPGGNLPATPGAARPGRPAEADRCALFDIGRGGARAVVSEGPNAIRILFTSADQPLIKAMRKQARDFAKG